MDLKELQYLWQQYDKKISENTRLNKEILRRMLQSKPQKRINWIKIKAGFDLIAPIIILVIFIQRIEFRNEIDFYIGILFLGILFIVGYYWAIKYYSMIGKIDLKKAITATKKEIIELEKLKLKITRFSYILSPFALIGVLLVIKVPHISEQTILPIILIIVVFALSIYYTYKYSIFGRFKKLNSEIEEIEQLEKE